MGMKQQRIDKIGRKRDGLFTLAWKALGLKVIFYCYEIGLIRVGLQYSSPGHTLVRSTMDIEATSIRTVDAAVDDEKCRRAGVVG